MVGHHGLAKRCNDTAQFGVSLHWNSAEVPEEMDVKHLELQKPQNGTDIGSNLFYLQGTTGEIRPKFFLS